ncbi:MAG: radical SAM protein [Pseudomonadota bacterium]
MSCKIISNNKNVSDFFGDYPLQAASMRLTMACNAHCKHCYTNAGKKTLGEHTTQEVKNILDELTKLGAYKIFFTGGEPFLRKDIVEILEYAHEKSFDILISTNGTYLDESKLKAISHIPFFQFQISIDGPERIHDENRGTNFYKKANDFIKCAQMNKIKNITLGVCITKSNINYLDEIMRVAIDLKVDSIALMLLLTLGRATKEMDVTPKELVENLNSMFEEYRKSDFKVKFAENSVIPPVFIPKDLRDKGLHLKFIECCSYPHIMGIGVDGDIAPCDGFLGNKKFVAGNYKKMGMAESWKRIYESDSILQQDILKIKGVCSQCVFLTECAGNCRASSIAYYNDIYGPFPTCQKMYDDGLFPKECLKNGKDLDFKPV